MRQVITIETPSLGDRTYIVHDGTLALTIDVPRDIDRVLAVLDAHDLLDRLDELPDQVLWVHCASGFRASIASSLRDRAGHHVVLIDDDFDNAGDLSVT